MSIAAFSMSAPAFAVTVKKQPAVKQQTAVAVTPVKKATTVKRARVAPVATAKKAAIAKPRVATAAPAKKVAVAKRPRATAAPAKIESFDRHDMSGSADYGQQSPQNVRGKSSATQGRRMPHLFASSDPVSEARRWIGTNPTDRDTLWCARFMNFVLERSGFTGTGSDAAKSFASYGQRISGPQVGAIAVMSRGKNGGHVGIVSGIDSSGNPIIISGNSNGRRVYEGAYPRGRIYAYVLPR